MKIVRNVEGLHAIGAGESDLFAMVYMKWPLVVLAQVAAGIVPKVVS
jgi:hypothetical protein